MLFLVLFLFYCAYFMLRFSVEPGPQRANLSAVYALFGVVADPRQLPGDPAREGLIHPVVFTRHGPQFDGWILVTYCVAQAAMLVLAYTLYRVELAGKRIDVQPARAEGGARVTTAEKYVTAAYCVVFAIVLVYVRDHRAEAAAARARGGRARGSRRAPARSEGAGAGAVG